jgi:hypothetical protein
MARTKMVSATFTTEEYAAIEKAASQTDRNIAAVVRWVTIKYLRDLALLPYPGESVEELDE